MATPHDVPHSSRLWVILQQMCRDSHFAVLLESCYNANEAPRTRANRTVATAIAVCESHDSLEGEAPQCASQIIQASSSPTGHAKEQEKQRLRALVKDFARRSRRGMPVTVVHPRTLQRDLHTLWMDPCLTEIILEPKGHMLGATRIEIWVRDVSSVYTGAELASRAPQLGVLGTACVGMDVKGMQFFFYVEDRVEREHFRTCLSILRMSLQTEGSTKHIRSV